MSDNNNRRRASRGGGTGGGGADDAERDKKRQKMFKKMGKLLGKAWSFSGAQAFHEGGTWNLANVGQRLDHGKDEGDGGGKLSFKQAWQSFATDLGSVYTTHIVSKSKHAKLAQEHLDQVKALFSEKDASLGEIAASAPPVSQPPPQQHASASSSRKRSSSTADAMEDDSAAAASTSTAATRRSSKRARTSNTAAAAAASAPRQPFQPSNKNPELAAREVRAMEQLREFIVDKCGGTDDMLDGFQVRVTRKKGQAAHQAKFDINFFSTTNRRRFRSMLEVGRFYNLVDDSSNDHGGGRSRGRGTRGGVALSKEQQAEKKKIRKDLDRLRKALNRATDSLDQFAERQREEEEQQQRQREQDEKERAKAQELLLQQQQQQQASEEANDGNNNNNAAAAAATPTSMVTTTRTRRVCAATRLCDVNSFPHVPQHCMPDVLMAWDFLCTFHNDLLLHPIELPDFCAALAYQPPTTANGRNNVGGDDLITAPPVYLVESHLALLKLLLHDNMSEDWWWSTVETDAVVASDAAAAAAAGTPQNGGDRANNGDNAEGKQEADANSNNKTDEDGDTAPMIKVDMALLLAQEEDALITTSWVKSLEDIKSKRGKAVRMSVKAALKLTRNKWVVAYLKKAMALYRQSNSGGPRSTRRAIHWLVDKVKEARPDLADRSVENEAMFSQRAKVVEQTMALMEELPDSAPIVTDEDAVAAEEEYESEEDESDDDEEDEDDEDGGGKMPSQLNNENENPASSVPPKPLPTLVDMLLPNEKPSEKAEYISPFTWSPMTGAVVHRFLHRRKRIWNEVDDSLRAAQNLAPLTVPQRQERERQIAARVFTECYGPEENSENGEQEEDSNFVERAIEHLCSGRHYLEMTFPQRLAILRLLIEAAYDTFLLYNVVSENYNQRLSAMKSLEQAKKTAKKAAKDKAMADEAAARDKLATEAREHFLDEKRDEIRKLNEQSKELSDDMIESLTDEDIIDFDEDIKADYEALPVAESFTRTQVAAMVERMQQEDAFDTHALKVLTLDRLLEQERMHLEEMQGQLLGFGGEEALDDPSLDRETIRAIEALKKDIDKAKTQAERLPPARDKAIEQLKDAMQDGTVKVLRNAITAAKKAKLTGPDDETGGVWVLDLLRDAAVQHEDAKQNKKLIDAQKDLIAKRNKCFIRTEPVGRDRFGNRFWTFSNEEDGNVWAEAEYSLKKQDEEDYKPPPGFANVVREGSSIAVGARDREEDFVFPDTVMDEETCQTFSRKEYHSTGFSPNLVLNNWGCHTSEESLRKVIKTLDGKSSQEKELKTSLQESLEKVDKQEHEQEPQNAHADDDDQKHDSGESDTKTEGDEDAFSSAKKEHAGKQNTPIEDLAEMTSAIGKKVRVRISVDVSKDSEMARYETGTINGWATKAEEREVPKEVQSDSDYEEMELEPKMETVQVPIWRVWTELGNVVWLNGGEVLESMSRHQKMQSNEAYFEEEDASFLGYRNTAGKFSGKPSEAQLSSSPANFAKLMVRREGELYPKLKMRSYDEHWGGGERAGWMNKMKDYAFDTQTVKQGLLDLENAFFQLTSGFAEYNLPDDETPDATALLEDPVTRVDIELESDKTVQGLWNSPGSRAVFIEIVSNAPNTGLLALALELLCRNTTKYCKKHGLLNTRARENAVEELPSRRTRRKRQETNYNEDWF